MSHCLKPSTWIVRGIKNALRASLNDTKLSLQPCVHVSKFLHLRCYVIFRVMLIINKYNVLFGQ